MSTRIILFCLVLFTNKALLSQTPKKTFFRQLKTKQIVSDQKIEWNNFGPGISGYCEEFWCHPTDSNVMFMGPDMHVSYGTWDNGKSWQTIKDSDGDGQGMERVLDICFSKKNPDFGVAIERKGLVFTTNNKGRDWELVHTIKRKDKGHRYNAHTKIAIHPDNDDIWLIGAGDFWNVKYNHRSQENIRGIKNKIASYGYILKTEDKGKTWSKIATDISSDLDVARIIYNPNDPNIIIIATNFGVYRSTNGGQNWSPSNTGLPNNLPRDLTSFYNDKTKEFTLFLVEQTVYEPNGDSINTKGGVYKSIDGGVNWVNITGDLSLDFTKIKDWQHRNNYHKAISHWLGQNSKKLYPKLPEHTFPIFNRIVVNPINQEEIYLVANQRHDRSFGPGDAWTTKDGGKTWEICARAGLYWLNEGDKEYWQTKGYDRSANVSFAHLQSTINSRHETRNGNRLLSINSKGEAFIGVNQQIQKTANGGKTWEQIDDYETAPQSGVWIGRGASDLPGRYMLLETGIKDRYLFCSGEHGLWQSADLGNWEDKTAIALKQIEGQSLDSKTYHSAHSISTVAVHPNNPDIIYILPWRQEHMGKVRRSMDGGKTWENIATIFTRKPGRQYPENPVAYQNSLTFDKKNPKTMYFCATRTAVQEVHGSIPEDAFSKGKYGVYKSTDMGFTWKEMNRGLPDGCSVRRLTVDPKNSNIIYASLNLKRDGPNGGLYKSMNGARSWKKVTTLPTEIKSVNNLFIDRNSGYLYASCGSNNSDYESGGVWVSKNKGNTWSSFFKAPYVWQTEVSPVNSNIITVNVPLPKGKNKTGFKNPGLYLTQDGGKSWSKINKGIGQPNKMTDFKPDPYNEKILWSAGWGSGWFKTTIP